MRVARRFLSPVYKIYEKRLERQIKRGQVPKHLAVIMDGNRRYAEDLGILPHEGHIVGKSTLENLSDLLDFVLKGNLDKPFKRPSLYSGKEGYVREFNFGKKQKSEIIKCLNYFFPEKQINLNDESIWYKSENLINY